MMKIGGKMKEGKRLGEEGTNSHDSRGKNSMNLKW